MGAAAAAEKSPKKEHFQKHWHPKESWVVHEPKDIDCNFDDEKEDPKDDQAQCVQRKRFAKVFPVPVVILQNGGDHCDKRDAHDASNINLEAEAKARKVLFGDEPLEAEEKYALYHQLPKGLANNF